MIFMNNLRQEEKMSVFVIEALLIRNKISWHAVLPSWYNLLCLGYFPDMHYANTFFYFGSDYLLFSIYIFLLLLRHWNHFFVLSEWPVKKLFYSYRSFDLDMQKARIKMSSLVKSGIDDPGLCVCEYRLRSLLWAGHILLTNVSKSKL
jgi:hypothetical protein